MHPLTLELLVESFKSAEPVTSALQGARHIVEAEGLRGLYRGLLPTLLRDVPEIAIQFALYDRYFTYCKNLLQCMELGHSIQFASYDR